jgi:hypothetical protein
VAVEEQGQQDLISIQARNAAQLALLAQFATLDNPSNVRGNFNEKGGQPVQPARVHVVERRQMSNPEEDADKAPGNAKVKAAAPNAKLHNPREPHRQRVAKPLQNRELHAGLEQAKRVLARARKIKRNQCKVAANRNRQGALRQANRPVKVATEDGANNSRNSSNCRSGGGSSNNNSSNSNSGSSKSGSNSRSGNSGSDSNSNSINSNSNSSSSSTNRSSRNGADVKAKNRHPQPRRTLKTTKVLSGRLLPSSSPSRVERVR